MRKLVILLAAVLGLSGAAHAAVTVLHYYGGPEGATITNDVVGGADGTLYGISTNTLDRVVTDGGAGTWSGGNLPQGMKLPASIAAELSTNAFTISIWSSVNSVGTYQSEYAFHNGLTDFAGGGSWILATPRAGNNDNASYTRVQDSNATYSNPDSDDYVDVNGPPQATGVLYNKVFTYDGSEIKLYINAVQPNYSGGPSTANLSDLDMSDKPNIGVNAGSPWADNSIDGETYIFSIFGQALTEEDVEQLYFLGTNASQAQLAAIGDTPFKFRNQSPTGGGVTNDVTLSVGILDNAATYDSATMYLDSYSNSISSAISDTSGITNTLSSVPVELAPGSEHTVYVIATGTDTSTQTNSWTFTMGEQFNITVSPEAVAVDYDFQPTVSVDVENVSDEVTEVILEINGAFADIGVDTINYEMPGVLAPGSNVTARVIATGSYGPVTNDWVFTQAGNFGLSVWNSEAPSHLLTGDNVYQLSSASNDTENVEGIEDNAAGHEWTYVAGDRPAEGQTFLTGSGNGFDVSNIWVRTTPYDDGGAGTGTGDVFRVRLTNPAYVGTPAFVISEQELVTQTDGNLVRGSGQWIQLRLNTPVTLNANTTYGFDVGSSDGFFNYSGINNDPYLDGAAYRSGDNGAGNNTNELSAAGDRTFIVELTPSGQPFVLNTTLPVGGGVFNQPTLEVNLTVLNAVFDEGNSKLFLDGVEQFQNPVVDNDPEYTMSASLLELDPLSTHTAMVVIASSSPVLEVTNTWQFTMADKYTFYDQSPTGLILTNETPLSVKILNQTDYPSTVTMHVNNGPDLGPIVTGGGNFGTTSTVSVASSGTLVGGKNFVKVIADGLFGPATNEWQISIAEVTTDNMWNMNVSGTPGFIHDVPDGVITIAPSSGSNVWNNVDGAGNVNATNISHVLLDSNGENPITVLWGGGNGFWGTWDPADVDVSQDLFWSGVGTGGADVDCTFTNLNPDNAYDVYVWSTWRWPGSPQNHDYEIVEGFGAVLQGDVSGNRSGVQNAADDDYSGAVEGDNYFLFEGITPTVDGFIGLNMQSGDGVISGVQIRERVGEGSLPDANVLSVAPEGLLTTNGTELVVVMVDYNGSVDTNGVLLLLDDSPVVPDSVVKVGSTTTVTYATGTIAAGDHTAGVQPTANDLTNVWTFALSYEEDVATALVHHWDFEDGSGTTVADIVGGADGTIIGTNYAWVVGDPVYGGALDLFGGGSSADWNGVTQSVAGAYVNLPNYIMSNFTGEATIEAVYVSESSDNWERVYTFGTSNGGEDISDSGGGQVFLTPWSGSVTRIDYSGGFTADDGSGRNPNKINHLVLVIDPDNYIAKAYRNGVQYSFQNGAVDPLSSLNDVNNWFGRSNWPDTMFGGKLVDIKIYTGTMTEATASSIYDALSSPTPSGSIPSTAITTTTNNEVVLSWPVDVDEWSVLQTEDLVNGPWVDAGLTPVIDGGSFVITNGVGAESELFYQLEYSRP